MPLFKKGKQVTVMIQTDKLVALYKHKINADKPSKTYFQFEIIHHNKLFKDDTTLRPKHYYDIF